VTTHSYHPKSWKAKREEETARRGGYTCGAIDISSSLCCTDHLAMTSVAEGGAGEEEVVEAATAEPLGLEELAADVEKRETLEATGTSGALWGPGQREPTQRQGRKLICRGYVLDNVESTQQVIHVTELLEV
jgi:hypothetical protein